MTYQELIMDYPWIDVALEIFKGVMPTVIAILTIFITESCISKRERRSKHNDKKSEYYETVLEWLIEMKNRMFSISEQLENVFTCVDFEERKARGKEFYHCYSEMNTYFLLYYGMYSSIVNEFGADIDLSKFEKAYKEASANLMSIFDKYRRQEDTTEATDEINQVRKEYTMVLDVSIADMAKAIEKIFG